MTIVFEHEIRLRAYEMWQSAGMSEGEAERHWLHAERIVRNEAEIPTSAAAAQAAPKRAASRTAAPKKASAKPANVDPLTANTVETKTTKSKAARTGTAPPRSSKAAVPRATA